MRYEASFCDFEKHVVKDLETAYKCSRYLLNKWKKDFPDEMVRIRPVPDEWKITWPEEDKES